MGAICPQSATALSPEDILGKMMGVDPAQRCSIVKGAEQAGTPMAAKGDSTGPGPRGSGLFLFLGGGDAGEGLMRLLARCVAAKGR